MFYVLWKNDHLLGLCESVEVGRKSLFSVPSTEEEEMSNPLKPSVSVLSKLGSLAVHCEEMLSAKGHMFDRHAIAGILLDGELKEWLVQMDQRALLPVKR